MDHFELVSEFEPTGDQPQAIEKLVRGFQEGNQFETLLGVTGSGKTFTMANIIQALNKPTLILAHNKTLAAQLYSEFKAFFPHNAVEYFVSYYDYYQPEAYVPSTDTYIEKDSSVNDEIDKLRHSATAALIERKDVIVVSSVSCIYGIGNKKSYTEMMISLRPGMIKDRDQVIDDLINIQYVRNELDFKRGTFRVKGDVLEVVPVSTFEDAVRIEFFGDEIDRIVEFDILTGEVKRSVNFIAIFPASHYVVPQEQIERAIKGIKEELAQQVEYFKENDQLIEAQRIAERTNFDIEMMRETGFCSGIENYSRHLAGLKLGEPPNTLIDFFDEDFLMIVDESHMTIPQIGGMYAGDRSRKSTLVDFGFRLPSALDNRPLEFSEFEQKIDQMLFVSATPGKYEKEHELLRAEQIIRPTGLLDPSVDVRPVSGQIDDLLGEIRKETEQGHKVLVTTLTKRMAEELTDYMREVGICVKYLHSDIDTLERIEIVRDLRMGVFDVLVGINLLREGLDIPEITLVAILDADKEGFLRSETSLVQTIGRAARNSEGHVIMYADTITDSMEAAISETNRRREIQDQYNKEHGITPQTIQKDVRDLIKISDDQEEAVDEYEKDIESMTKKELKEIIERLTKKMNQAAAELNFEEAAKLRDELKEFKIAYRDYDE
ncbi:MAG TPA: excinuclease ABC subunit UvrB [Candidatus Anaerostipes avistercoris]|uniref:UvrABC system protein B n=1 Tax=Candidatus Anaerostipes avistercoris TaxID=2838462 RepID=A0A9D2T8Y6_9FIRM|nr:excinuclease ABC subunit UvrB [Candidatus Anaerostipes avistercoris]